VIKRPANYAQADLLTALVSSLGVRFKVHMFAVVTAASLVGVSEEAFTGVGGGGGGGGDNLNECRRNEQVDVEGVHREC
jgi:hypothetical protein